MVGRDLVPGDCELRASAGDCVLSTSAGESVPEPQLESACSGPQSPTALAATGPRRLRAVRPPLPGAWRSPEPGEPAPRGPGRRAVAPPRRHVQTLGAMRHARVGGECEHVTSGLDGGKARARDEDGLRAREALDGRSHGGLQLEDLGGGLVAGVDRLAIGDDWQRQHAVKLLVDRLTIAITT